jgi:hypothetical protein
MLSHEEKIRLMQKKKKILLIAVLIVIGVFVLVGITLLILSAVRHHVWDRRVQDHMNPTERRYIHPDADWDRNIFEDSFYMSLDRSIKYNDGVGITVMTEENQSRYPPAAQFMYDVVQLIINGDYEAYNEIFADEYYDQVRFEDLRLAFPMQPLYNIEIQTLRESEDRTTTEVKLTYMIHRNDGMFRPDLPYDEPSIKPFVYRLIIDADGEIKVSHKFPYQFIAAGDFE